MPRTYQFPAGRLVREDGQPSDGLRAYLEAIQRVTSACNDITKLDSGTSYTADQLRDHLIEILTALQGDA